MAANQKTAHSSMATDVQKKHVYVLKLRRFRNQTKITIDFNFYSLFCYVL